MSLIDDSSGPGARDLAAGLRRAADQVHGLAERAARALDGVVYEGPAARRDRDRLAAAAAQLHGFGVALDELAAVAQRVAAGWSQP